MLHNILGFGGRLGRLEYFMLSILLGVVTALLAVALIFGLAPPSETTAGGRVPPGLILGLALVVLPIYLWFSLAFQAKRIRDIGWNPLYVLPGWIAALMIDRVVAFAVPTLALGVGGGTLVGVLFNLLMAGLLLFWPSRPSSADDWDYDAYYGRSPAPEIAREAIRAPRPAAARTPAPMPVPSGFGRRGL